MLGTRGPHKEFMFHRSLTLLRMICPYHLMAPSKIGKVIAVGCLMVLATVLIQTLIPCWSAPAVCPAVISAVLWQYRMMVLPDSTSMAGCALRQIVEIIMQRLKPEGIRKINPGLMVYMPVSCYVPS